MAAKPPPPMLQVDTREKQPFTFKWSVDHKQIAGVVSSKMDAGDYGLVAFPRLVTIERKKTVGELYNNLVGKDKYERFIREMERMLHYKHRYIIVEQTWDALWDKRNFKFAKRNMNYAGAIVLSHLIKIQADYGIHIHFAGEKAQALTLKLLLKHYEWEMNEVQ